MYKTLGCLAGSMTGTAALLAWIDPSPTIPTRIQSHEELLAVARSLVLDDVAIRPAQWRAVEVVEGPSMRGPGVVLSAGTDRRESHFFIDERGRLSRAGRWDRQLAPSDAPNTIRVEMVRNDSEPFPSPAQSNSIEALIDALNEAAVNRDDLRPIRPAGTLAAQ